MVWWVQAARVWLAVQDTTCMDLSLINPSTTASSQATSVNSLHLIFQFGK
jgi:hypothetical protein